MPISMYELQSNTTARVETFGATNGAKFGQTSFLMDAGVQYADEGEYPEAEQAYLRALANDPGNPDVRFRLSTLYIMMKRYRESADLLNALAVEFPGNAMTHNNLAWIYATGGEMKNGKLAVRHAREAILSGPTQPPLWNTLAEAYYVVGQYDEALRASECAMDLLKVQSAPKNKIAEFEEQHTKILRAQQAYKRLMGTDDKK
ncbi:MAG: tetratricopeptide repeat protein [Kiritimatiellales bacterium]